MWEMGEQSSPVSQEFFPLPLRVSPGRDSRPSQGEGQGVGV